jgi:hypothetical protein
LKDAPPEDLVETNLTQFDVVPRLLVENHFAERHLVERAHKETCWNNFVNKPNVCCQDVFQPNDLKIC